MRKEQEINKKKGNLSINLHNFILANELSRAQFADLLNEELAKLDPEYDPYTANDIWTFDSRKSLPKNPYALAAISRVIGKSLDDLIVKVFTLPQLIRPDLKPFATESGPENVYKDWNIELLDEMTDEQQDVLFHLVNNAFKEDGIWRVDFLMDMTVNLGKEVLFNLHYGVDSEYCKTYAFEWTEFAELLQFYDGDIEPLAEFYALNSFLEPLDNYNIYSEMRAFDVTEDRLVNGLRYFDAAIFLSLDSNQIMQLIERKINKLQNEMKKSKS